jgi:hypothetical protein
VLGVIFVAGAVLMVVEIVGARIVTVSFGSTIYIWGTLLGIFMGALSLGYYLGGRVADRLPSGRVLGIIAAGAGVSVFIVPLFGSGLCELLAEAMPAGRLFSGVLSPGLAMLLLFTLPAVAIGSLSPLGIRILTAEVAGIGSVSGKVYGASAVGSIAGSLLVVFFLMAVFPNRVILISAGVLQVLAGVWALLVIREKR